MFQYRDHRGSLSDSMDTLTEFSSRGDLVKYLQADLDVYGKDKHNLDNITIEKYGNGIDHRIMWTETHIVRLDGFGVLGFTDSKVE